VAMLKMYGDSLLTDNDDETKSLFFTTKLEVRYNRLNKKKSELSKISLSTPEAIVIQEKEIFFSPRELVAMKH
jgi:hypothetical protein